MSDSENENDDNVSFGTNFLCSDKSADWWILESGLIFIVASASEGCIPVDEKRLQNIEEHPSIMVFSPSEFRTAFFTRIMLGQYILHHQGWIDKTSWLIYIVHNKELPFSQWNKSKHFELKIYFTLFGVY